MQAMLATAAQYQAYRMHVQCYYLPHNIILFIFQGEMLFHFISCHVVKTIAALKSHKYLFRISLTVIYHK